MRNLYTIVNLVRASPAVLNMWSCKNIFSHPSLVIYFFLLGQQTGELLIANHLDESLWWANQKYWAAVKSYLLHSFLQVHRVDVRFTSYGQMMQWCWAQTKFLNQTGIFWFFFIQFFLCNTEHCWRCSYMIFWNTLLKYHYT